MAFEFDATTAKLESGFDPTTATAYEPPKPAGAIRRIADQGIKLAQGVVGVPEAAVGVADLVTGGRAGKMAESAGVRFKDAKAIMGEYLSPEQKAADQEVAQAEGFLPTIGAMVQNPSTIAGSVMESAPSMIGGGAAARGLLKVAPKLGAIAAGAAGEGLVSAGQNAEQVRQETASGLLTPEQSAILAASGALTGGISLASGKLANKLGIGDVQTMLASGKAGVVGEEAAKAAAGKGVVRKLAEGMANEGVLQELPQSYQEQVAQNIAQGKPWDEGAAKAGAQGMLAGAVMGGGANVVSHVGETAPVPEAAPEPAAPALQIGNTPDPYLSFPDGTVARRSEIDAYINSLPAEQQPAARAKAMGLAPQPGTQEPVVKPSEAMGLDPAAGPLSAAAVTAVDTGAHQEIQLQQASEADQAAYEQATAEQEQKVSAPKPTPAAHEYSPYADANGDIVGMDQQPFRTFREALIQRQFENKAAGRNDFEAIKTGENQFVVRRVRYPEKQSNGPSTEVQPGDTGSTGVRSTDSPASVGVGATDGNGVGAQPRRSPDAVLDQAGQLPKRADAAPVATTRAQPTTLGTQTTATAGPGFTAKDVTRVQNAAPGTNTTPAAQAVEAPAVVESNAATAKGLPGAGTGAVETAGVIKQEFKIDGRDPHDRTYEHRSDGRLNRTITYSDGQTSTETLVTDKNDYQHWVSTDRYAKGEFYPLQLSRDEAATAIRDDMAGKQTAAPVEAAGVARIDDAAHTAATSPLNDLPQPTEAQKIAGNYPKGHVNLNGLDLSIENPAGSVRSGKDKSGKAWSNTLQHHYGYIKGTVGNDKDHVDLFVKPGTPLDYSGQVFVIDQVHPDTGRFDEHKVVVGAKNGLEARRIYQANYAKGWKGLKALTAMPFDQFKAWVKDGPKNKPVSSEKPVSQPHEQAPVKRSKNGYAEIKLNGRKHFVTPFDDHFVIRNPIGAIAKSDNEPLQFASEADAIAYAANTTKPQEQPNGTTPAQAITPTTQREAQAPDASQRLTPAQAGKLQEAHKAHGLDVTLKTVQKMHDRVMKSLITGKGSNGGVEYNIKPKERKELQAQADRLANDLSLFGVQQEAATPAPVAQSGLERMRAAHKAKNAKPVEPVEQPTPPVEQPAQASSSRPGEPTAEQIESVGDVVRITKSAGKEIKHTVNASTAMKTLNERAEALQMLAEKCK